MNGRLLRRALQRKLSDQDQRLYEMALADLKNAERMLPVIDEVLEIIDGKRRSPMRHNPLEHIAAHEIIPRWADGMPAWCEVCDATLTEAEVEAINTERTN